MSSSSALDRGKLVRRLRRRIERTREETAAREQARERRLETLHATDRQLSDRAAQLQTLASKANESDALGRPDPAAVAARQERAAALEERDLARRALAEERRLASYSGQAATIESTIRGAKQRAAEAQQRRLAEARSRAVSASRRMRRSRGRDSAPASRPQWDSSKAAESLIARPSHGLGGSEPDRSRGRRSNTATSESKVSGRPPWCEAGHTTSFAPVAPVSALNLGGIGHGAGPIDIPRPRKQSPPEAVAHPRPWAACVPSGGAFHEYAYNRPPTAHEARRMAAAALPDRLSYNPSTDGKREWQFPDPSGRGGAVGYFSAFSSDEVALQRQDQSAMEAAGIPAAPPVGRPLGATASAILAAAPQRGEGAGATWRGGAPGMVPRAGVRAVKRLAGSTAGGGALATGVLSRLAASAAKEGRP